MANVTNSPRSPGMLFALIILAAHMIAAGIIILSSPTHSAAIAKLTNTAIVVTVCLALWWLRTGNLSRRERLGGLILFLAAFSIPTLATFAPPTIASDLLIRRFSLLIILPVITTVTILTLWFAAAMNWSTRRWVPIAALICTSTVLTCIRVDGMTGDQVFITAWRWSPPPVQASTMPDYTPDPKSNQRAALPNAISPGDWPEFRGPNRDAVVPGVTFDTNWATHPPKELWRMDIGLAWSSFTVVGDYFFTQEQRGKHELVVCYESDTAKQVWVNSIEERYESGVGIGPQATPTYVEGKLYCQGATGILQCIDAATGETLWKRDIAKDTDADLPQFGFASSPLVTQDTVIAYSAVGDGKSVIAYNRTDGTIRWNAGDGIRAYNSPQIATIAGIPQLLMASDIGLQSFNPETGELLWQEDCPSKPLPAAVQPRVIDDGTILIGYSVGARLIQVTRDGNDWTINQRWNTKRFRPYFNDLVHHNGHLYGFDRSHFNCVDATTGDRAWKGNKLGGQVILLPDMDTLLILTEKGKLLLLETAPEEPRELASIQALEGKTWNHPVIAHGKLFIRNDHQAIAYQL